MFIMYAADSTNVTVSPRLGTGQVQPQFDSSAQISVLEGTGIGSDGSLIANVRCDTCLSWTGGSMDPTDSSSNWIWGYKTGNAIDSTSTSANIQQHSYFSEFTLDLTKGTGGSSSNPFVQSSDSSSSSSGASASGSSAGATATATATASPTGGVSAPLASSNPSSAGSSHALRDPNYNVRVAHAVIMPLVFIIFFPVAALTIYLPYSNKVRYIHAPLQVLSLILMIVGFALGVKLATSRDETDKYHEIVGYIVVFSLILFQPALGLGQHLYFRRTGGRSPMGHFHRWLGRIIVALGVVNGGLGFMQSGPLGSENEPHYAVILYSCVAGVIFLIYLSILFMSNAAAGRSGSGSIPEKKNRHRQGYEMYSSSPSVSAPRHEPDDNYYGGNRQPSRRYR